MSNLEEKVGEKIEKSEKHRDGILKNIAYSIIGLLPETVKEKYFKRDKKKLNLATKLSLIVEAIPLCYLIGKYLPYSIQSATFSQVDILTGIIAATYYFGCRTWIAFQGEENPGSLPISFAYHTGNVLYKMGKSVAYDVKNLKQEIKEKKKEKIVS